MRASAEGLAMMKPLRAVMVLAAFSLVAPVAFAQRGSSGKQVSAEPAKQESAAPKAKTPATRQAKEKLALTDATRVDTDEAVRRAAREMARKSAAGDAAPGPDTATAVDAAKDRVKDSAEDVADRSNRAPNRAPNGASSGTSAEPAVLELQPASATTGAAPDTGQDAAKDKGKGTRLKSVHGSVSGSLDPKHPGTRQGAASVGASSKDGKTSVYVEADQGRATTPPPH